VTTSTEYAPRFLALQFIDEFEAVHLRIISPAEQSRNFAATSSSGASFSARAHAASL